MLLKTDAHDLANPSPCGCAAPDYTCARMRCAFTYNLRQGANIYLPVETMWLWQSAVQATRGHKADWLQNGK